MKKGVQEREWQVLLASAINFFVVRSGRTKQFLANSAGICPCKFSMITNARRDPSEDELCAIARAFGVSVSEIESKAQDLLNDVGFARAVRGYIAKCNEGKVSLSRIGRR